MKLFLLSQDYNNDYDTYDKAVVVAETPEAAVLIHPGGGQLGRDSWSWVDSPEQVTVTEIGTADPALTAGVVICASFNQG